MEEILVELEKEANEKGLKVIFINFKRIKSLLTNSIIFINDNISQIEKRCCLAYEIVHFSRNHTAEHSNCLGHSKEEEEIIRQETAKKLIPPAKLYLLLEDCYSLDEIAEELKVTKEVLEDYFKYCKSKPAEDFSYIYP